MIKRVLANTDWYLPILTNGHCIDKVKEVDGQLHFQELTVLLQNVNQQGNLNIWNGGLIFWVGNRKTILFGPTCTGPMGSSGRRPRRPKYIGKEKQSMWGQPLRKSGVNMLLWSKQKWTFVSCRLKVLPRGSWPTKLLESLSKWLICKICSNC